MRPPEIPFTRPAKDAILLTSDAQKQNTRSTIPEILPPGTPFTVLPPEPAEDSAAGATIDRPPTVRPRSGVRFAKIALSLAVLMLAVVWLVEAVIGWVDRLATTHPLLAFLVIVPLAAVVLAGGTLVLRHVRLDREFVAADRLRSRLEQARAGTLRPADDWVLRSTCRDRMSRLTTAGVMSPARHNEAWAARDEDSEEPIWVDRVSGAFTDVDRAVQEMIESEARLAGLGTALAPTGPIDSMVVLWRQVQLARRVARAYGVAPGIVGTVRLVRRIAFQVVTVGVAREGAQLLATVYGPEIASVFARWLASVATALPTAAGPLFALDLTGGVTSTAVTVVGTVVRRAAEATGATSRRIGESFLRGTLTAVLTVRVGLAAQDVCRPVPMTENERRSRRAGIVGLLTHFRKPPPPAPAPSEPCSSRGPS